MSEQRKRKKGQDSADLHQSVSYLPDIHRLLPQAVDAERGTLSSLLLSPPSISVICEERHVDADRSFHLPAHGIIFNRAMTVLKDKGALDFISLTQALADNRELDEVGGAAAITELFTFLPTAANASYYIDILEEKSILREIIKVCTEYAARSYDEQDEVMTLLDEVQEKIMAIASHRNDDEYKSMKEIVMEAIHDIEYRWENRGTISGLSTGFIELDKILDGLHDTELIILAARPSMGKTALAMNIAEHVAIEQKLPVAVFSLEMSSKQLTNRMIFSRARVDPKSIQGGYATDGIFPKLTSSATQLGSAPIHMNDKSGISINYLRAVMRSWKKKYGIRLGVVDYLQLLRGVKNYKGDNRQGEIAEISGGLKNLAKELGIPLLVLAQLNRNVEGRKTAAGTAIPKLSDLRESGAIEQDADAVLLLHREEMYAETDEEKKNAEGKATVIVGKQRNGPTGSIPLTFLKEFSRFENRAHEADVEDEEPPQRALI